MKRSFLLIVLVGTCLFGINAQPMVGRQRPPAAASKAPAAASKAEVEKTNRESIQRAVSKSLNELNESATGKVRLSIRLGSDKPVFDMSFSPDGKQVLVVQNVSAILYDVESGVELKIFRHSDIIVAAAFSPDGRQLVTGSIDKTARLWNVQTGREIRRLEHQASLSSVGFSPDGRLVLTGSADQTARLWNAATGTLVTRFKEEDDEDKKQTGDKDEDEDEEDKTEDGGYEEAFAARFTYKAFSAIFADQGRQVVTGDADQKVRFWDIKGKKRKELEEGIGFEWGVRRVVVSPDGRQLVTESDGGVQLWDLETGEEVDGFEDKMEDVQKDEDSTLTTVAFSPDGRFVLGGYTNNKLRLIDRQTWGVVQQYQIPLRQPNLEDAGSEENAHSIITTLAFSADGKRIAAGSEDGSSGVWEASTGKLARSFQDNLLPVHAFDVSSDGRRILIGAGNTGFLWDIRKGNLTKQLKGHSYPLWGIAFSPDSTLAATTSSMDSQARFWTVRDGSTAKSLENFHNSATAVAFSPDGKSVLIGERDEPELLDIGTGKESVTFKPGDSGQTEEQAPSMTWAVAFSRDGKKVLSAGENETAIVWDAAAGTELARFKGHTDRPHEEKVRNLSRFEVPNSVLSVAFSPDGNAALTAGRDNTARIWDARTGAEHQQFLGHSGDVFSARFSPDGRKVLTASADSTAVLWDAATGKMEQIFAGHRAEVTSAAFLPGGKLIFTGSRDGTVRLWQASTGKELCSLISFRDGGWLVVAPDGRFDTNNLEEIRDLNWIAPDDPLHPLPLEIFVRDYYEPRLLARLLNGEALPPIRNLSTLNRLQPRVTVTGIAPEPNQPDLVSVTVEVAAASGVSRPQGQKITVSSGAYDLRLFRDGQLVGQNPPEPSVAGQSEQADQNARIIAWRLAAGVKLDPRTGKASLTFRNIRLPRGQAQQVDFSAYAFNRDRVRSSIARRSYTVPEALPAAKGRAYIIAVGVNASENPRWDLRFAVSDAELMQRAVAQSVERSGQFQEVIPITLVSSFEGDGRDRRPNRTDLATKANLKAVIDLLAGKSVNAGVVSGITNGGRLQRATPEDLVLIAVASHGIARNGTFLLAPYDIGNTPEPAFNRFTSSEELSQWLRGVDAGEMALIVDACESRASFEAGGYKPGPMGDRGLGQLAYDKGMRILAASQNEAIESERIGQGLLTYALVHDGLTDRRADYDPKDGVAYLAEWLAFGVERVPELFDEIVAGNVRSLPRSERGSQLVPVAGEKSEKEAARQQPSLFDFAKKQKARLAL